MKKINLLKLSLISSLIVLTWFIYSKYFKNSENLLSKPIKPSTSIDEGIKKFIEWYLLYYKEKLK